MRAGLFWLNNRQWARIERHLPTGLRGPARDDDRRIISGIIHMLQSGARWRDCPSEYGPYTTVYNRFNRWSRRRIWQKMFNALVAVGAIDKTVSTLSSYVKAHRSAGGGKGGPGRRPSGFRGADGRPRSTSPRTFSAVPSSSR